MPNYRYKVFKGQKVVAVSTTLREAEAEARRIGGGVLAIKNPAVAAPAKAKDLTKTAAFKRWFGNSKVVDKNGKPLVVYHGTNRKIHVFDPNVGINAPVPKSVYFSDDPNIASWVAKNRGSWEEGGKVIAAYLRIENPLVIDANGAHAIHLTDQVASLLRRDHDGVIIKNVREFFGDEWTTTFAVFSPTQIKSATGNRGTFDPHDPDIRNPAPAADQTKSAAFKKWFGKSKVVKGGKPLVAYHGSPEYGFKVFDLEKIDAHHVGFFFTDKRDMANTYAEGKPGQRPKRSGIYEVYLRIEEPFEVDAKGAIWDNIPLEYEDWDGTIVEERASTTSISRTARDLGHDGCIIHNVYDGWGDQRGDVFVVFKPNQVKSVDNRGTFSRYDDNIRNPAERTFIPPPAVAAEARKALDLRAKQPPSNRCCTPVGIARAKQLANRQPVSETTLRRMKAYFDRHAVDAKGKGWGVDSKGWQAWLAWGGTSGRKWCENILRSL